MDDDVGAVDELLDLTDVANVAAQLLHRALELGVVERHDVEGPHLVAVRKQAPREMQAEEARAARDCPQHQGSACLVVGCLGREHQAMQDAGSPHSRSYGATEDAAARSVIAGQAPTDEVRRAT